MLPLSTVGEDQNQCNINIKARYGAPFCCAAFLAAIETRTIFQQLTLEYASIRIWLTAKPF